eukprot:scaffold7692_cov49-Isochrysis_galbana.AAC.1
MEGRRVYLRTPQFLEHPLFWGADAASICRRLDCVCVNILYFWAGAAVYFGMPAPARTGIPPQELRALRWLGRA